MADPMVSGYADALFAVAAAEGGGGGCMSPMIVWVCEVAEGPPGPREEGRKGGKIEKDSAGRGQLAAAR